MQCAGRYCGNVRLIQMSVFVDAATAENLAMSRVDCADVQEDVSAAQRNTTKLLRQLAAALREAFAVV
eukprot:Skav229134  [mRNA]  locus=scaffold1875:47749:48846:+ [translate_table: standard]